VTGHSDRHSAPSWVGRRPQQPLITRRHGAADANDEDGSVMCMQIGCLDTVTAGGVRIGRSSID